MNLVQIVSTAAAATGIVGAGAGAVVWYDDRQEQEHVEIQAAAFEAQVELSLQQVQLEIKMFRAIQERRDLTPDERDRLSYLLELRRILLEEQRK